MGAIVDAAKELLVQGAIQLGEVDRAFDDELLQCLFAGEFATLQAIVEGGSLGGVHGGQEECCWSEGTD